MAGSTISGGIVKLTIDGAALAPGDVAAVTRAVVDQRLDLPATCTVMLDPIDRDSASNRAMDFGTFALGIDMDLAMDLNEARPLFRGKIAALEPNLTATCREIEITGYDALFDLDFGAKARTFVDSTDSDIVSQVIEGAGFEPDVETLEATYPYVLQNNVSDYAFVLGRARRIGFELSATGRQVAFRASRAGEAAVATLEYGVGLTTFRSRARALKRGASVTRLGWDPKTKQIITATVDSGPPRDRMEGRETGYAASSAFGSSAETAADASVTDTQVAEALARGAYRTGLDAFLDGTAECPGNPAVVVGANVALRNIGDRFDGLYYVVAARHSYDRATGYRTNFEVRRTGL